MGGEVIWCMISDLATHSFIAAILLLGIYCYCRWKCILSPSEDGPSTPKNSQNNQDPGSKVASSYANEIPRENSETRSRSEPRPKPFKRAVLDASSPGKVQKSKMPIYKLPLQEEGTNQSTKSRICVVDDRNALPNNTMTSLPRTIVMMGATGAGKSTLIEGLVNYAYGVEWTDDFRFTIIDLKDEEKANKAASQAKSQTEWITTYVIRPAAGGRIAFLLRVVDMPGFGDTAGIDKDKELVKRLGELFAIPEEKGGIEQVDMVCLVVQASLARLTASQSYILNSLKEIFDKSIAENICAFITFNDGSTVPPVLAALKQSKTPFQKHFVFNNSALYDSNKASGFSTMHWDKGLVNYRNMLEELQTMQSKSLQCSKEVLDKRAKIQAMTVNLKNEIAKGLSDLDELTQEAKVLKQREHEAEQNRDYTYEVTERIMKKRPTSSSAMNCDTCKKSCHYPCGVKANLFKRTCAVMSWSAECTVCSNCSTSSHSIENFEYHLFEQTVTKTHEDMKKRYFDATKGGDVHQNMVNNMKRKFLETQARVKSLMDQIMKCEEELSELALTKSSPISRVEYLKMMRDTEDRTRDPGYKHRIKMYDDAIEEQNLMADAGSTSFNPWGKYIDLLDI